MTDSNRPTDRDLDRSETFQDTGLDAPGRSRTYRLFALIARVGFVKVTVAIVSLGVIVGLIAGAAGLLPGGDVPRSVRVVGIVTLVLLPFADLLVARRVRDWLWDPSYVYLVDVSLEDRSGGLWRFSSQSFRDVDIRDGELDWMSPILCFGQNYDPATNSVEGTWLGSLSDRELMVAQSKIEELRGRLERDAKRGFSIEVQAFGIIRSATMSAVRTVVNTFERSSLPDDGEALAAEIDDAISQFGVEDKIRQASRDDRPESDLAPDADLFDLDADADPRAAADGGASDE